MATLIVRRPNKGYQDRIRKYAIWVDGVRIGKLSSGDELSLGLEPGRHNIQARIDWSGSPVLSVDISESDQEVIVQVEPDGSALGWLKSDGWIGIKLI